jgi:hypothetical protein
MLAGAVGLVLSLIAIYGIHQASTFAARQTADILDSTKEAVVFLKRGTTKTHGLLNETKTRAHALDDTLADIVKKVKNSRSEKTLLDRLDDNVVKQLLRAQSALAALRSTLEGFQNTLVLFNSLERFAKSESRGQRKGVDDMQELSRSLMEAAEILDRISRFLDDVLTDRAVTLKGLDEATIWVKEIQGRLVNAEHGVDVFHQRLTIAEERILTSERAIPQWIDLGGMFAMLLLACFAFTQIGLMIQGQSLLRANNPGQAKSDALGGGAAGLGDAK